MGTVSTSTSALTPPKRADARRNYDALLAAAAAAFREQGTEASLDDIARRAGVGNATLYRNFPDRQTLLAAVFMESVQQLERTAEGLLAEDDAAAALKAWMRALIGHSSQFHGFAHEWSCASEDSVLKTSCATLTAAMEALVVKAKGDGVLRAAVDADDVGRLTHGIALAAENASDPADTAERLIALAVDGMRA